MTDVNIKYFKLSNGEDILAVVQEVLDDKIVLLNPMKVLIDSDLDNGKQTIYMHSWIPQGIASGNVCSMNSREVIFTTEVEKEIASYYIEMVTEMSEEVPKKESSKKEYMDEDKKVVSFVSKSNKDTKLN
ncbi:hypothetical protein UFOVP49_191 [uncultured Caudovirales phage]|uniref:Uncharacterized protein n=1 Tax=uncultured Caudovirales phage TaxID=2100421 RepID=A0A6J5KTM5_9CAUD|nr:hypothetical protein UFOVP49_191 [uncultured Caudovirales phage]